MHEFDIDVPGTIRRWEPWRKHAILVASIILLVYGIGFFIWFIFIAPNPAASILGN
jgi:hypothetical protein